MLVVCFQFFVLHNLRYPLQSVSKLEIGKMQTKIYEQAKVSLRKILQSKQQPFDEEFRKNFLAMSHDKYGIILLDCFVMHNSDLMTSFCYW